MTKVTFPHKPISFEWDEGNDIKNWIKHFVSRDECEQVFSNKLKIFEDTKHSTNERRFTAYGESNNSRKLTVVFTYRKLFIRIISARDQNKNERIKYETK